MSRRNLTRARRAFRSNPRSFLNKITEQPISITIDDGVTPYTVKVSPISGNVLNQDELPASLNFTVSRSLDLNDF